MARVVVTGLGVVSPLGCDLKVFWDRLTQGVSGLGPITRFDTTDFPVQVAAEVREFNADLFVAPKEQRRMDRYCHFALAAAKLAVADSGIDFTQGDSTRCGVAITSGVGGIQSLEDQERILIEKGPRRVSPFCVPQMITNMAAGLVAIEHKLRGPNYAVVTACASAMHSIGFAMRSIRMGECDVMLAGGAESPITPISLAGFSAMKALSTRAGDPREASRPFDLEREGFVAGEGAGILLLESAEHAARRGARVYAELSGFGMTCDAFHITAPCDDGDGARRAMLAAMADAGVTTAEVDYINAHGTSTPMNDKIETLAIKRAMGESDARRVMVSSTKSMTGHLLGAAGGIESVVCALALHMGVVPPTINYTHPDPDCDLDYVPNTARIEPIKICLNNSFGFGGHNACLAFRRV